MKQTRISRDCAVSPVVGVMLMLVVVLIIAAVASGFAGSLVANQKTAPSLAMDVKISNTGTWIGSGFYATVTGVSAPIPTSDLKIVTSWSTINKTTGVSQSGGGAAVPGLSNVNFDMGGRPVGVIRTGVAPFGVGPGVGGNQSFSVGSTDSNPTNPFTYYGMHFGNYSLVQGTTIFATPAGAAAMSSLGSAGASNAAGGYGVSGTTYFRYSSGFTGGNWTLGQTDPVQGLLGQNWENLRMGDIVRVKVIHVPSGKIIYQKDVAVTEG